MKLSDDRINELAHRITEALKDDERVTVKSSANAVRLAVRRAIGKAMRKDAEAVERAETKITSQKKNIQEDTAEWDALFRQYYEEELARLHTIR
jgi:uncharacterized protein